jgi:lysophosphatidic acid acyltransferase/lysophosphatidylinositol acyltransferase
MLSGAKAIMKDVAKYVPGIGWMFMLLEFPIVKRNWEVDKKRLAESCRNLADYPVNMVLCLFAEGTRFTEEKHKVSMEIAKEKGLPILKHHLLPRPKGFTFIVQHMKDTIPAIYDVTFGYCDGEPTIVNLLNQVPCSCDIGIRLVYSLHT